MFESLLVTFIVYMVFLFLFYKTKMENEYISSYECGFNPSSLSRSTFSYRFFLISILFIIFDVEISLMLPIPFLSGNDLGLWVFSLFILVLIVGLVYEYMNGALEWLNFISKA